MRLNNKSTTVLNVKKGPGYGANAPGKSFERLSSGYRINSAGDGSAVLIPQNLRIEGNGRPQLIRSSGARRAA